MKEVRAIRFPKLKRQVCARETRQTRVCSRAQNDPGAGSRNAWQPPLRCGRCGAMPARRFLHYSNGTSADRQVATYQRRRETHIAAFVPIRQVRCTHRQWWEPYPLQIAPRQSRGPGCTPEAPLFVRFSKDSATTHPMQRSCAARFAIKRLARWY